MAGRLSSEMEFDEEWRAFYETFGSRLIGSVVLFCGDRERSEDCAHEALVRAFERWDRVRVCASPEAWVYRTALNLVRSSFRRDAVERRHQHRLIALPALPDAATALAVRDAVRRLPERQRSTIIARFYLGLDVAETAAALRCREGTVKAHTFRAMQRLRTEGLIDDEEDDRAGTV